MPANIPKSTRTRFYMFLWTIPWYQEQQSPIPALIFLEVYGCFFLCLFDAIDAWCLVGWCWLDGWTCQFASKYWKYLQDHIRHGNGWGMLKLPGHVSFIASMLYTNCCLKVDVPFELHGSRGCPIFLIKHDMCHGQNKRYCALLGRDLNNMQRLRGRLVDDGRYVGPGKWRAMISCQRSTSNSVLVARCPRLTMGKDPTPSRKSRILYIDRYIGVP